MEIEPAQESALAAVRASTRELHDGLEARLVLSRPGAGRNEYVLYGEAMLGWLDVVEAELWSAAWPVDVEAATRDHKRAWLREDLVALGASSEPPRFDEAVDLSDMASRFGVAYVVEGSQLGGQVLLRRLGPALAPHVPRYLAGHGGETGPRWRSFVTAFESHVSSPDDVKRAAASAHAAFAGLSRWFARRGAA